MTSVSKEYAFPSTLISSRVIFLGHAFTASQVCTGLPDSSNRLTVTVSRWIMFCFTWFTQSRKALSSFDIHCLMVRSLLFLSPGIFSLVKTGLSPAR